MKSTRQSPLWETVDGLPATSSETFRFALINQAAFAGRRSVIAGLEAFDRYPLLNQPIEACVDGATPFLLDINLSSVRKSREWKSLCNYACYANAISVLDTTLSTPRLVEALTQRCDVILSDGQTVVLRYFDTRIIGPLADVLDPDQRRQFFACAFAWRYAARDGELRSIGGCGELVPVLWSPLRLTALQTRTLKDISEADGIIDLLTRNGSSKLLDIPYPYRHAKVKAALQQARETGLGSRQDLAAYCSLVLEIGSDAVAGEPWKTLLERVRQGDLSFTDALETADAETT